VTTHHFSPQHYHTTLGWHEPVLWVESGDRIVTTTVDAAGQDASGNRVTQPGNPQTGPFFVAGAEPGDTLKVSIEEIIPTGDFGFSRDVVAPNTVDPTFAAKLPDSKGVQWRLDHERQAAVLLAPGTRLEGLELSFEPMVGCFGVAPQGGQAISTATSWTHGGNMDYRGFGPGVSVYLPVSAPGALFFLGDVHALQGDGEVVGTGVEVASSVTFRLEVLKGKPVGWPRGENATYIFTAGNARPLDQALQHATTEMLIWLRSDFGLDIREASTLLGQAVRYDIGNVFDPAYTVVCKLSRQLLERFIT
jgi:amidase